MIIWVSEEKIFNILAWQQLMEYLTRTSNRSCLELYRFYWRTGNCWTLDLMVSQINVTLC